MSFFTGMIYKMSDKVTHIDKSYAVALSVQEHITADLTDIGYKVDKMNILLTQYNTEVKDIKGIIKLLHKNDIEKADRGR